MYGGNTKYHGNPYIQGTTVPCDIEQLDLEEDTTEGICTQLRVCCTKLSCNFVTEILIAHNVDRRIPQSGPGNQNIAAIIIMAHYVKPIHCIYIQWKSVYRLLT